MNENFNRLNADERAFARALQAAVRPAIPPDAHQLDGLYDRLTQSMRREEECMWLSDSLRALRRCAAAVIILVVSLAFGFRSTNSLVAELARESAPEQADRLSHSPAKAPATLHAAPAALISDAGTGAGMQHGQMIQPFADPLPVAPQTLTMRAAVADGISPSPHDALPTSPRTMTMRATTGAAPQPKLHLDILPL